MRSASPCCSSSTAATCASPASPRGRSAARARWSPTSHRRGITACSPRPAVFGALAAAAGAWIVLRLPWLLALATLACVPARIPVHVGSTQANLLATALRRRRGRGAGPRVAALRATTGASRELGPLAWPLALFVGWEGLTCPLDEGRAPGRDRAALLRAAVRAPRRRAGAPPLVARRGCSRSTCSSRVMALVFAVIGIVQYETRNIFWNPKVKVDNAYAPSGWFYRVNSVFYDPSIYGRFLVVGILASLVIVIRRRGDPLWIVAAALTLGITWAGPAAVVLAVELRRAPGRGDTLRGPRLAPAQPDPDRGDDRGRPARAASRRRRSATASRARRPRRCPT